MRPGSPKPVGLCDALEGVAAGFNGSAGSFETQAFHGLGGRRSGLGREGAGEIARAHRSAFSQTLHGERLGEVRAHPVDQFDEAPCPSTQFDESRELQLAAWPALMDDELLRDASSDVRRPTSGPRSSSISASARSMPAEIPAEVQIWPSRMKMRSASSFTFG